MAVTTIFSFFYGTRPTQYKVTPTSQYKVTPSISPNSQLVLAPFLDGRRFVSCKVFRSALCQPQSQLKATKLLPQSCILFRITDCPSCITDSLKNSGAIMRINIEVAACVAMDLSKKHVLHHNKITPSSQYKVTPFIFPISQFVLAPFFHGRRFLFLQSLLIGALPAASSATGEKLLSQSCILFHKTGCPCCITDSLQKSSATMRINIEVAACIVIVWSKKSKSRTVSLGDLMHQELL